MTPKTWILSPPPEAAGQSAWLPLASSRRPADHASDFLERIDVRLAEPAVVAGPDVQRKNVAVLHRAEVVLVDLLGWKAKAKKINLV